MFSSLINKDKVFFEMLEKSAANVALGARALADLLDSFPADMEAKVKAIKDIEHQGDMLTHQTIEMINKTFVTPIDREDIHNLGTKLDDIIDLIDGAASRLALYKIDAVTPEAKSFAQLLIRATDIIVPAIACLRKLSNSKEVITHCVEINTIENEGDKLMHQAMINLFAANDAIKIIKWKEIYQILESATDRCEDVANVIEGIVLKYS
ncbi:MAG: DUF47 domain-containing protein [Planctomycetes bacterium]|nr:DUF47 domain-containing protein [Planctomycetota bacterium]